MTLQDLTAKKIAILGYGQEGQAVLSYLKKHGLEATVLDEKADGSNYLATVGSYDVAFRSPGIWRLHPAILKAEESGTIITSQTKWFFENCDAKIIGVTGTKGKGTTCSLIYETMQTGLKSSSSNKVYLTGNIGKTPALEFLDDTTKDDWIVFELSSFQLQDLTISPRIGICLMVTSDHLNHHKDLDEYHKAKSSIVAFQRPEDFTIYNIDYPATRKIGENGQGLKLQVSMQSPPQIGASIEEDIIKINLPDAQYTIDCADRKLRGRHNLENIAASSVACLIAGIDVETIQHQVKKFAGLEHRLQFVGTFNDISYYNDSISTVPETTVAAIHSFDAPIHLFLGGSDKGLNYDNLISELNINQTKIASISLLGEVGNQLKEKFAQVKLNIPTFGPYTNFETAIAETIARAKKGEIVLLSPASASFDMFNNYAERGQQFVQIVKAINQA